MANDQAVAELESFLAERADQLMRTAVLLTGSREAGQDLLQTGLERLLRHWPGLTGDPEAYLRRTLYNLAADGYRRRSRLQRKLLLLRAETPPPADTLASGTRWCACWSSCRRGSARCWCSGTGSS
jgi:DNA-directed RNA polymerase specialized sigma24 family protein